MSASTAAVRESTTLKWSLIVVIAILIPALQVGLPWLSCYLASDPEDAQRAAMGLSDQRSFWSRRFSFDRFLHPSSADSGIINDVFSATVCQDELVILRTPDRRESGTIDRINLRTGKMISSVAPAGTSKILSDGDRLWFLTDQNGAKDVFLYQGRFARFQQSSIDPDDRVRLTHELEWFEDERWQPTGQFALIPYHVSVDFDTDLSTGQLCCVFYQLEPWFQCGVKLLPRDEHLLELHRYLDTVPTDYEIALRTAGWHPLPGPGGLHVLLGHWSENDVFSVLYLTDFPDDFHGFRWYLMSQDGQHREQFFKWPTGPINSDSMDDIHFIRAHDGLYFIVRDSFEGRWTVYRWDGRQLILLVNQRSPVWEITCLDAALFSTFAFVIPTIILALAADWIRRWFPARDEVPHEFVLASIGRRGIARVLDLWSWGIPLLLSLVLHPQIVFWWHRASEGGVNKCLYLWSSTITLVSAPSWNQLLVVKFVVGEIADLYLSIPLVRPLAVLALVILIGQLAWQCQSGQMLGKWLMGIRVVRTDLRRCGWGRCLVREAFLLVDGFLFLSWIPGVICMLITSKSQRIGDLFPDTIVIRNPHPMPIRSH
jgi:uncharacterized RDD family membrane protein YckC